MKSILLTANYNNKLGCIGIFHIAAAPAQIIWESQLNQPYLFKTEDSSHEEVVYYLEHLVRYPIMQIPFCYTWCSHAMWPLDFAVWYMQQYGVGDTTELAVYYYHLNSE